MTWINDNITVSVERPIDSMMTPTFTTPRLPAKVLDAALDTTRHLPVVRVEPPDFND